MKRCLPLLFLFLSLLLLLHHSSAAAAAAAAAEPPNNIDNTCRRCSAGDPALNYSLCVSILESNPRSLHANLTGLAVISLQYAIPKAVGIRSAIHRMLNSTRGTSSARRQRDQRSCLEDCLQLYSDAVSRLRDSAPAIKSGRIDDARTWISAAVDAPRTCENGFRDDGLRCPLKKENDMFFNTVIIPLAIAALLDK